MSAAWLLVAFVLGMSAGAFLCAVAVLLGAIRAAKARQDELIEARRQLGRP